MIGKIWSQIGKLLKTEENQELITPTDEKATFSLKYKNIVVGNLRVENGTWKFSYSDEFKTQNIIAPLVDFPEVNRMYESEDLWPFFSHRIPGMGQPQVQEIIRKENIDKNNDVVLLKRFGHRSISNPFELNFAP